MSTIDSARNTRPQKCSFRRNSGRPKTLEYMKSVQLHPTLTSLSLPVPGFVNLTCMRPPSGSGDPPVDRSGRGCPTPPSLTRYWLQNEYSGPGSGDPLCAANVQENKH